VDWGHSGAKGGDPALDSCQSDGERDSLLFDTSHAGPVRVGQALVESPFGFGEPRKPSRTDKLSALPRASVVEPKTLVGLKSLDVHEDGDHRDARLAEKFNYLEAGCVHVTPVDDMTTGALYPSWRFSGRLCLSAASESANRHA
jgi:hypothetical protein